MILRSQVITLAFIISSSYAFVLQGQRTLRPVIGEIVCVTEEEALPVVEPHISAHPSDDNIMLIGAMVVTNPDMPYRSSSLSTYYSSDCGKSWSHTSHNLWGYDPWTCILPNGEAIVSWLGTKDSFKGQFPLQFLFSQSSGKHWNSDLQTIHNAHGHDGTKMVSYDNRCYFTTARFNNNMSADIVLYERPPNGIFSELSSVGIYGKRLNFCEPIALNNKIIIPTSDYKKIAWSSLYDVETRRLADRQEITKLPGGDRGYFRFAADTSSFSAFRNRSYFVRAASNIDKELGVWLNYSDNYGENWSIDIRVDSYKNNSSPSLASVAINNTGIVAISWIDNYDSADSGRDLYFAFSTDGGLHFSKPFRVTHKSSIPKNKSNKDVANKFPSGGHYMNLVGKPDGSFQLVWSDSTSGIFKVYTCNVSLI